MEAVGMKYWFLELTWYMQSRKSTLLVPLYLKPGGLKTSFENVLLGVTKATCTSIHLHQSWSYRPMCCLSKLPSFHTFLHDFSSSQWLFWGLLQTYLFLTWISYYYCKVVLLIVCSIATQTTNYLPNNPQKNIKTLEKGQCDDCQTHMYSQ